MAFLRKSDSYFLAKNLYYDSFLNIFATFYKSNEMLSVRIQLHYCDLENHNAVSVMEIHWDVIV